MSAKRTGGRGLGEPGGSPSAERMVTANLAVRFVLELCAFAALGYWGYDALGVAGAILAPLVGIATWGLFVAPKARFSLSARARLGVELLVFAAAVAGLAAAGATWLAIALGLAYAVNRSLLALEAQRL